MSEALLDLFSTSPILTCASDEFCTYNAPYFAYKKDGRAWGIAQGNCHHWDCPKCGVGRARKEYGRIIEGCRKLQEENSLFFITVTCRGKRLRLSDALTGYLSWTNRLNDALRVDSKTRHLLWCYVAVTEQQGRGHPHSHILTTYYPPDLIEGKKRGYTIDSQGKRRYEDKPVLRSEYLQKRVLSAGLGEQYDISIVDSAEGASRYVAKYLFKSDMFKAKYPKGWKRVRYSNNFPKLPEKKSDAIVLLSRLDWLLVAHEATVVHVSDENTRKVVEREMRGHDVLVKASSIDKTQN